MDGPALGEQRLAKRAGRRWESGGSLASSVPSAVIWRHPRGRSAAARRVWHELPECPVDHLGVGVEKQHVPCGRRLQPAVVAVSEAAVRGADDTSLREARLDQLAGSVGRGVVDHDDIRRRFAGQRPSTGSAQPLSSLAEARASTALFADRRIMIARLRPPNPALAVTSVLMRYPPDRFGRFARVTPVHVTKDPDGFFRCERRRVRSTALTGATLPSQR